MCPLNNRRAISPRAPHDYDLLATFVACPGILYSEISHVKGFELDYLERLLKSAASRNFVDWLEFKPLPIVEALCITSNEARGSADYEQALQSIEPYSKK